MIHPGNCCPAPSPVPGWFQSSSHFSNLLLEFSCANPATPFAQAEPVRIVCFRNFSQHAHAPSAQPLKTPLAPSAACFQVVLAVWRYPRTETFVPPKVNRGSAAIYCSGMTGIRWHRAFRGPIPLPWICFLQFLPGLYRGCHPTAGQHWLCRKRSTLFHLLESRL